MNKNNGLSQLLTAFIYIIVLFQACYVYADESSQLTMWASVKTYHVDRANDDANFEQNQIKTIFYDRWFLGHFINSYRKESWLFGYQMWHYELDWQPWQLQYGVSLAAATGYGRELATNVDGIVTLGVSPYFGMDYQVNDTWSVGADILYIPTDNGGVFVSGVSLGYSF